MPAARLYILSESEFDDEFFRVIVERVTGYFIPANVGHCAVHHLSFIGCNNDDAEKIEERFLALRAKARTLGGEAPVFLAVIRDNDRGPFAPTPADPVATYPKQLGTTNRLRQLEDFRDLILKDDGHGPVFPCAVGVSVQMIESWILLAKNPALTDAALPLFADKYQSTVKKHYAPAPVPDQLKDLYDIASDNATGLKRRDFNRATAEQADLDSLAARSPSFAAFRAELKAHLPHA